MKRVRPCPWVCACREWSARLIPPRALGALPGVTGVMRARAGGEWAAPVRTAPIATARISAADPATARRRAPEAKAARHREAPVNSTKAGTRLLVHPAHLAASNAARPPARCNRTGMARETKTVILPLLLTAIAVRPGIRLSALTRRRITDASPAR